MKQIVMGLGTGRCGTRTFGEGLDKISNIKSTHEAFPKEAHWIFDLYYAELLWDFFMENLENYDIVADTAFYNLNYIKYIKYKADENNIKTKFACFQRDKEETINSYLKWTDRKEKGFNKNHWTYPYSDYTKDEIWDSNYPRFLDLSKEQGIRSFWDLYYGTCYYLRDEMKNFEIFDVQDLNQDDGLLKISSFLELPKEEMKKIKGLRKNQHASKKY